MPTIVTISCPPVFSTLLISAKAFRGCFILSFYSHSESGTLTPLIVLPSRRDGSVPCGVTELTLALSVCEFTPALAGLVKSEERDLNHEGHWIQYAVGNWQFEADPVPRLLQTANCKLPTQWGGGGDGPATFGRLGGEDCRLSSRREAAAQFRATSLN